MVVDAPARRLLALRAALLGASIPAVWALARWDVLPHLQLCLFQRFTGRPCPGCGMTRAFLWLSQGDVLQSLRMHPLGVVLAAAVLGAFVGSVVGLARGGDPVVRFLDRWGVAASVSLIAAFFAVWIVRSFVVPEWAPPDPAHDGSAAGYVSSTRIR